MSNEFDAAVAAAMQPDQGQAARVGFSVAAGTNPDAYAEAQRVARRTGVPVDTVLNMPKEMARQDAVGTIDFDALAKTSPATSALLADIGKANIAHDDVENMGLLETMVNSFRRGIPALKSILPSITMVNQASWLDMYRKIDDRIAAGEDPKKVLGDYGDYGLAPLPWQTSEQSLAGWQAFKAKAVPKMHGDIGEAATDVARLQAERAAIPLPGVVDRAMSAKTWGGALSEIADSPFRFIAAIGPESLMQSLPGLVAAIPAGYAAGPAGAAATMGGNSFLTDYASTLVEAMQSAGIDTTNPDSIRQGLKDPAVLARITEQAGKHAGVVGAVDALSGGIAGKMVLPKQITGKLAARPLAQEMANIALQAPIQGGLGALGELGGELYAGQEIQPGNVLAEAFGEFFGTPSEVVSASVKRIRERVGQARQAEQDAQTIAKLNELAKASKVLQRDPETFEQFIAQAAENGPVPQVFIDANVLMQTGVAEQVAAVSPSVADQLATAVQTGGQIAIPAEEYMARIAPTEYSQSMLDHLKTDANGYSRAEAQEIMQNPGEELKAEFERTLTEKQGDEAFKASADAVKADILGQLNATNRFRPEVHDAYASLVSNFFAVTAAKLGRTPEELFKRYALNVAAERIDGQQFDQGETLDALRQQWADAGLKVDVSEKGGIITLSRIVVPEGERDAGKGTAAMNALVEYADRTGQHLALSPSADFGGNKKRLVQFYKRFGFVENKGKNRAFTTSESMYRQAQGKVLHQSSMSQTDTPEFKRWFGDSKVVDAQGRPLVVYHGTTSSFDSFSQKFQGAVTRATSSKSGFFFTSSPRTAQSYADHGALVTPVERLVEEAEKAGDSGDWDKYDEKINEAEKLEAELSDPANRGRGQNLMPVYLDIKNPLIFDAHGETPQGIGGIDPLIKKAKRAGHDGVIIKNFDDSAGLSDDVSDHFIVFKPEQIKSATGNRGTFDPNDPNILHQDSGGVFGTFHPESQTITLLKKANLTTFLHEAGHFFLEVQFDLASKMQHEADMFGMDTLKPEERRFLADNNALLRWFGVDSIAEWYNLDFEEKRAYHEKFARGFEAYLYEGKSPSIEMHGLFQRFRDWMVEWYKSLSALNVELTDEIRGVFDRMIATEEQIKMAEQGRSMMPLFTSPEQSGMTTEGFAAYQARCEDATNDAIQNLQARRLRDTQWIHNARGRIINQLKKESRAKRAEVQMEVRREVMSHPIYRAWQFLTGKLTADDKIAPPAKRASNPDVVDETRDSLSVAIAKIGGINRESAHADLGVHEDDYRHPSGVFGKPVFRKEGGRTADEMAAALAERGYLETDETGKHDLRELEDKVQAEIGGDTQFSREYDYSADQETRAGDQFANPQALGSARLDLGALAELGLPDELISHLKALKMTAKNGLHPDLVAEIVGGFTSGDDMVRRLLAAESPRAEIDARTDARMLQQFGDLSSPEAIERAADQAVYNEARARVIETEANALSKATGQRTILASAAKMYADQIVSRLKIRNINPGQFASAGVRAAKFAEKAFKAGDIATAAAEKRNQVFQNYATRAAYDAKEEIDKGLRYLKKFEGDIKSLDAEYSEQIGNLLERFDLRKGQSNKAIDKRTAMAEWIKSQREAGFEPDIPANLENEAFRTSYKNLTVEEFRGLVDSVRQIEHLGRLKHKLLTAADQRAYEAVRDEIAASIHEHAQGREADTRTPTTNMGRAVQGLKRFWAAHIKAATLARVMDGGKDGGTMWEYFIRSANQRGDQETTMRAEATAKLSEILAPVFKLGKMGGKGQFFSSIGRSLNREARLAIAMNMGNEGNTQRLLGGEGWTIQQLTPVLQSLTAQEWQAVQAVWDHFESYRTQIAAKERRVYGKEPEWVEPRPFAVTTADGTTVQMRGGYYPIKYDPSASQRAEEHADAEGAKRQLQGAYTTATTRRSFTKARAEEVSGRPLLYTLSGLYSGVNDVIHDLAWHEWLIDANRLLRSNTIDQAIREHYGPEVKQQFKTWASDIAEGEKGADGAVDLALSRLRQGISASGLGFNVMSAIMQPLGITQSITRVGAKWVGRGIANYLAAPIDLTRQVNEMSDFMANRARTRFRELNELRNQVQDQSAFNEMTGRYAYFLMMRCQQMVDVPTWWGAYEKAIAEGNEESRAVALADQAVIDSQGGGQTKDLSAIERGGPGIKIFTVFYSFMNTALNIGVAQTMSADTPAKRAKLAVDYAMLYVVPAVLGYSLKAAITPGDPGDDDLDKIAKKLLANQIDYLMGLMVVVREFAEAGKTLTGANDLGRDYTGPSGLRLVADTGNLAKRAHQREFDDAFRKAAVNVVGDLFGLPSAQTNRTVTGAKALKEGKTNNPAALVFGFQEKR